MGVRYSSNQDYSRAIEINKDALEIFHAIGDRYSEAIALNAIGEAYQYLGDYSNALSHHKNALTLFETPTRWKRLQVHCGIAGAEFLSGNWMKRSHLTNAVCS